MKSVIIKGLMIALLSTSVTAHALNRSQHDTAVGAVLGGVAGAVTGQDITSTVAGAALGGVVGSQWNAHKIEKERDERYRSARRHAEHHERRYKKHHRAERHHRDYDKKHHKIAHRDYGHHRGHYKKHRHHEDD
ncbi:glycine zipper 2TM domain-containing protein [Actinobacillus vicugnae]|uniref:glycine zipper 2TM domain-containing protein n=1 Tax=Actinobacillus vicugnae TaxID=2573093 RepID=UPI001242DFA1|nr:glycine zipper 2TM domain-containing protein [Actinobacillus vicugnae]